MRSKSYKCYNIECGACISKTLCGEPGDTALGCDSRLVHRKTNADHIRSMTDEELAEFLEGDYGNMEAGRAMDWLKQPYGGE